jgi:hypothetical protein
LARLVTSTNTLSKSQNNRPAEPSLLPRVPSPQHQSTCVSHHIAIVCSVLANGPRKTRERRQRLQPLSPQAGRALSERTISHRDSKEERSSYRARNRHPWFSKQAPNASRGACVGVPSLKPPRPVCHPPLSFRTAPQHTTWDAVQRAAKCKLWPQIKRPSVMQDPTTCTPYSYEYRSVSLVLLLAVLFQKPWRRRFRSPTPRGNLGMLPVIMGCR